MEASRCSFVRFSLIVIPRTSNRASAARAGRLMIFWAKLSFDKAGAPVARDLQREPEALLHHLSHAMPAGLCGIEPHFRKHSLDRCAERAVGRAQDLDRIHVDATQRVDDVLHGDVATFSTAAHLIGKLCLRVPWALQHGLIDLELEVGLLTTGLIRPR